MNHFLALCSRFGGPMSKRLCNAIKNDTEIQTNPAVRALLDLPFDIPACLWPLHRNCRPGHAECRYGQSCPYYKRAVASSEDEKQKYDIIVRLLATKKGRDTLEFFGDAQGSYASGRSVLAIDFNVHPDLQLMLKSVPMRNFVLRTLAITLKYADPVWIWEKDEWKDDSDLVEVAIDASRLVDPRRPEIWMHGLVKRYYSVMKEAYEQVLGHPTAPLSQPTQPTRSQSSPAPPASKKQKVTPQGPAPATSTSLVRAAHTSHNQLHGRRQARKQPHGGTLGSTHMKGTTAAGSRLSSSSSLSVLPSRPYTATSSRLPATAVHPSHVLHSTVRLHHSAPSSHGPAPSSQHRGIAPTTHNSSTSLESASTPRPSNAIDGYALGNDTALFHLHTTGGWSGGDAAVDRSVYSNASVVYENNDTSSSQRHEQNATGSWSWEDATGAWRWCAVAGSSYWCNARGQDGPDAEGSSRAYTAAESYCVGGEVRSKYGEDTGGPSYRGPSSFSLLSATGGSSAESSTAAAQLNGR